MSPQTSLETIHQFLTQKRIAMIGVSREPHSFSVMLFQELLHFGYDLIPVNPHTPNVLGHPCFARVQDVTPPVQAALLTTSPEVTERVVEDCAKAGVRIIWMYRGLGKGAVSPTAVTFCHEQGIEVIAGECPLMFLSATGGVHRIHGFLRKITGRYPKARNAA